jgi:fructokinase
MMTVVGEALVDLVDSGDRRTFTAHMSGSPLNVAVGLARLGLPTQLVARFSRDSFGRRLRAFAERNGVGLTAAVDAAQPSTLAVVSLDDHGEASYDFYVENSADRQWTGEELVVPPGTRILHAGSLASWLPPGDACIVETLRRARDTALVSYDPNVRPALLGPPDRARPLIERIVALAHLVKASEDDVTWLYPHEPLDGIARRWIDLGAAAAVITRGERGRLPDGRRPGDAGRPAGPAGRHHRGG